MIVRDALVDGRRVDVLLRDGVVAQIGGEIAPDGSHEVAGGGGALIPGLHDHHLHLFAIAAQSASVVCGPPSISTFIELGATLAAAPGNGWVRGVGYDQSVAGDLDRYRLDQLVSDRPVRVQHRSGSLWVLNSAALDLVGPDAPADGRLWRRDDWLRERLGSSVPDLAPLGARLAAVGITGVTDASPGNMTALATAVRSLPQRVISLGETAGTDLPSGPRKIVIGDHELPSFDQLSTAVVAAHEAGRPVAVHSVTRDSLLLLLAVLGQVGSLPGDRVEHAAVAPAEAVESLAVLGLAVVTQPSLIALRGDDYLDQVDRDDVASLWRYETLRAAGVAVVCSSDAPYGDLDPWFAIRAARDRLTPSGRVLGATDRVHTAVALDGYLAAADCLRAPPRRVAVGAPADLVLLDAPLPTVLEDPDSAHVVETIIAGRAVFRRAGGLA